MSKQTIRNILTIVSAARISANRGVMYANTNDVTMKWNENIRTAVAIDVDYAMYGRSRQHLVDIFSFITENSLRLVTTLSAKT